MKKIILALALVTSACQTFAQSPEYLAQSPLWGRSRTAQIFEIQDEMVNIRDVVYLKNYNSLVMELERVCDYQHFKNLDALISKLKNDIAFYRDSLASIGSGNVRIDYSIVVDSTLSERAEIRIKRHSPNGDSYMARDGDISLLKLEQDTVNFILRIFPEHPEKACRNMPHIAQASFIVNNYSDVFKMAEDKEFFNHAIDTLISTNKGRTEKNQFKHPTTTLYNPFVFGRSRFVQMHGLLKRGGSPTYASGDIINRSDKLQLTMNMGVGLVRNTLTPTADLGIAIYNMRRSFYTRKFQATEINTFFGLSVSPYFFFDRAGDGRFYVKDNWFVNAELGGATSFLGIASPLVTGGIGYLFASKGNYFTGTTMKAYMSLKIKNGPVICPELIFTGGFKQIFPGITVKLF